MEGYVVYIGDEELLIKNSGCNTNEKAKWIGAKRFRKKYHLKIPVALIVQSPFTKAFKLPPIPKDSPKVQDLVGTLKTLESTYRHDTRGQKLNLQES